MTEPTALTTERLQAIRERLERGEYHNREDWGERGIYSCEDTVQMLLEEAERMRRLGTPTAAQYEAVVLTANERGVEIDNLRKEKRQQFLALREIRVLCDTATGIDRSKGDARDPGAVGAVKELLRQYQLACASDEEDK